MYQIGILPSRDATRQADLPRENDSVTGWWWLEVSQSHQKHLSKSVMFFFAQRYSKTTPLKRWLILGEILREFMTYNSFCHISKHMNHLRGQRWQTIRLSHLCVITYANLIKYWIIGLNPYQSALWHSNELRSGSQHLPCSCCYVIMDYSLSFVQMLICDERHN